MSTASKLKAILTIRNLNFIVLIFISFILLFVLFVPLHPVKINSLTIENKDNITSAGALTYRLDRCRYVSENVPTQVIRNLVAVDKNGKEITSTSPISLNADFVANPRGCTVEVRSVLLPSNTPVGYYKLKLISIYTILPIRKPAEVTSYSDVFYVKPLSLGAQVQALEQELQTFQAFVDQNGGKVPANFDFSTPADVPANTSTPYTPPKSGQSSSNTTTPSASGSSSPTTPPTSSAPTSSDTSGSPSGSSNQLPSQLEETIYQIQNAIGLGNGGLLKSLQ